MNKKAKSIIRTVKIIAILAVSTFLCGFFAPHYLLEDFKTIITILLTVFGVALTIFIFMQNVVQNVKNNIHDLNKDKGYKTDKFIKLDCIVNELMGDIKWLIGTVATYTIIVLFFMQINNRVFQDVLYYVQYLTFSVAALAILDLIFTTFKLIRICSIINLAMLDNDNSENEKTQNEFVDKK